MHDGYFVFDNVVHMFDNTPDNVVGERGEAVVKSIEAFHAEYSTSKQPSIERGFQGRKTSNDEALRYLFDESDTDMAMAQTVPLFGYWRRGFAPAEMQYELKQASLQRIVFCGGVDPVYQGVAGALAELERQVVDMGAVSMKFYKGHHDGNSWRADDRRLAYPLYEKSLELGLTNVQFHCGVPFGQEYIDDLRPNDLQGAATDFPELTFIIHHLGEPYVDETISIAARFPNVWLALSAVVINQWPAAPWEVYHKLGKVLRRVGTERLLWGSEAFIWPNIQSLITMFAQLHMPEELQDKYGYPDLSRLDKRRIFGLNQARLLRLDVAQKVKELYPSLDEDSVNMVSTGREWTSGSQGSES